MERGEFFKGVLPSPARDDPKAEHLFSPAFYIRSVLILDLLGPRLPRIHSARAETHVGL